MNIILGLSLGLVFFLCTIKAYCLGIKHGKQLAEKEIPKLEPIKEVIQHFEAKQQEKTVESAIEEYWG